MDVGTIPLPVSRQPHQSSVAADGAGVSNTGGSTSDEAAVIPQKVACSQAESGAVATLSADEAAQLTQELEVLKEQPRAQMVPLINFSMAPLHSFCPCCEVRASMVYVQNN